MSKKSEINGEKLEKVNGGYILDDRRYRWWEPTDSTNCLAFDRPVKGWEKEQIGGSIKLIDKQGNVVEELQDMDKALAREKELGLPSGSINQGDVNYLRIKAGFFNGKI